MFVHLRWIIYCPQVTRLEVESGSWDDVVGYNQVTDAFCTGWRVLVLLKGVTNACGYQTVKIFQESTPLIFIDRDPLKILTTF